jgi:hypothetical protein
MARVGASMGAHGKPAGVGKEGEGGGGEGARHGGGMGRGRAARTVGSLVVLLCYSVLATFCFVREEESSRKEEKKAKRRKKREKKIFL